MSWKLTGLFVVAGAVFAVLVLFNAVTTEEKRQIPAPSPIEPVLLKEMHVVTPEGETVDLVSTLRGKPLLIDFWATWCVPCLTEIPDLGRLSEHEDWNVTGVLIDGYSAEGVEDSALQKLAGLNPGYRNFFCTETTRRELAELPGGALEAVPTKFFLDSTGSVRYVLRGTLPASQYRAILTELAGTAHGTNSTREK